MSETLEIQKNDVVTNDESARIAHTSHINENYQKLMNGSYSMSGETPVVETPKYPSLDAYRPLHARREITFEDVIIPAEVQREAASVATPAQKPAAFDYYGSIYADTAYREAAIRKERGETAEAQTESEEDTLSKPTSTTLQYGSAAATAEPTQKTMAATGVKSIPTVAEDAKVYYASLLQKMIIVLAVAFVAVMTVITINSAVLSGMDMQIVALQDTLSALQTEIQMVESQIAQATSWDTILAWIQANGMIIS